jgi:hypothetical protein
VTETLKLLRTTVFPGAFLVASVGLVLFVPALSRLLTKHLWTSYRTGFGQSVISVIVGLGLMVVLAGLIVWQVHRLGHGGTSPGGAFAGFGAGLGLLIAQVVLVRALEADPVVRDLIGRRD